jgi:hypothetical protein
MSILAKKYDITDAGEQSADIDELFRDIYEQLRVSILGSSLGAAGSFIRSTGSVAAWSTLLLPIQQGWETFHMRARLTRSPCWLTWQQEMLYSPGSRSGSLVG